MQTKEAFSVAFSLALLAATSLTSQAQVQLIWQVGRDDNAWAVADGGGPNTTFVQEAGGINPLPGNPGNPEVDTQARRTCHRSPRGAGVVRARWVSRSW